METTTGVQHANRTMDVNATSGACPNCTYDELPLDCSYGLQFRAKVMFSKPSTILAAVLVIIAILTNALLLLAISQVRMRLTGHLRLIISLATSDLLIGISALIFLANSIVHLRTRSGPLSCRNRYWCTLVVVKACNTTALNMSLFNFMAMAADHYFAILRPLHHQSLMNKKRSRLLLMALWTMSVIFGASDILHAIPKYHRVVGKYTFCELVSISPFNEEYFTFAISFIAFVQMLYCYVRICVRIKQRERCMLVRHNGLHVQLKYNTRGLITTLLIVGTFMLCWLPLCLFEVTMIIRLKIDRESVFEEMSKLNEVPMFLYDLVLVNAICDPIIYAARMSEVKLGYKRLFWKLCRLRMRNSNNDSYIQSSRFLEQRLSGLASSCRHGNEQPNPGMMPVTPLNGDSFDKAQSLECYKSHRITQSGSIYFE